MSPKELLYIEDALAHEEFCMTQCKDAAKNLQDPQLKQCAENMAQKHQQIFNNLFNLI